MNLFPKISENMPTIGLGQTISQPYIVAYMTELLKVDKNSKTLEIGTGSGYQAAILAEIVKDVYTIEIFEELGEKAQERFERLEYQNVTTKVGDGYYGWEEFAPFDGIIVTCAATIETQRKDGYSGWRSLSGPNAHVGHER
jgi:protein-L-isoaspartate(D-aspartate) O-methyltransferase